MSVLRSLTAFGSVSLMLLTGPLIADETLSMFEVGESLSLEEVAALERMLEAEPNDKSIRARLLGYYSGIDRIRDRAAQEAKHKHTLWFIRRAPESEVLRWNQEIDPCNDPAAYLDGKRLWLEHLERGPENLVFYRHAAQFMFLRDEDLSIDLLRQGQDREPSNPDWAIQLGLIHSFGISGPAVSEAMGIEKAQQALAQYEMAYEIQGGDRGTPGHVLRSLAEVAFAAGQDDKALEFARQALSSDEAWDQAELAHVGNIVLGKLALRRGDVKQARAKLLSAAAVSPDSAVAWFSPDFSLASSLLERGQKKAVLRYLRLCSRTWTDERDRLEEWIVLLRNDRVPLEFGQIY